MPTPEHMLASLRGNTDPDAMVLVQLAEAGSDLQEPHLPEFAFEVESEAAAQAIANELADLGFGVELHSPQVEDENPNHWVIAKRTMVLEWAVLRELSAQFEALAAKHGASYDGWGAEIVE
jgi:regulator of RNase E activity RraB